jgi:hypothetical protein
MLCDMMYTAETVLGLLWVWLAGFEKPPIETLYGGSVLIAALLTHRYSFNVLIKTSIVGETNN